MRKGETNYLYKLIGDKVRYYRTKAHFSQEELGRKVGKSRTSIVNIENGKQHPPIHLLIDLSRELNVSFYNLLEIEKLDDYNNKGNILEKELLKIKSEEDKQVVANFINHLKK